MKDGSHTLFPGLLLATLVGLSAQFLSEHYGAPAMLMALLLGIPLHFLAEEGRCVPGVLFAASWVLRFGVALLGVRISIELLASLGLTYIAITIAAVVATICAGIVGARYLGRGWRLGILTGGSVAICGASAAIAISAVLPKNEFSERNLVFTVLSVTLLSTVAMIAYPPLAHLLGFGELETGVFLGGTIHDVAQVVGAGFSSSEQTGEVATLVKLIRVSMLAPVVLVFALLFRSRFVSTMPRDQRPPLLPGFVLGFIALAAINSAGWVPTTVASLANNVSQACLLLAIAAVGMKTDLQSILKVGGQAIVLIVAETVFIALLIGCAIMLLRS